MTLRPARPEEAGFREGGFAELDRILDQALAERVTPGGVIAVGKDGALVHLRPFGHLTYEPGSSVVQADTLYDLSSLTKVVVTTSMAMILVDEGKLELDKPVSAFVPAFSGGLRDRVTVMHLLTHSAGFPALAPWYREIAGREAYLARTALLEPEYEPGTRSVYGDLGPILLGEVLERVAGEGLESFARRRIFEPLGMKDTSYRPGPALLARVAPTERDPWRGRLLRGEVHD